MLPLSLPIEAFLHPAELTGLVIDASAARPALAGFPVLLTDADATPSALPGLPSLQNDHLSNLLLLGGIARLDRREVLDLALASARVLRPAGRLLIAIPPTWDLGRGELTLLLESAGFRTLDVPGIDWVGHGFLLAENAPERLSRGLDRIQSVLAWDAKNATYKLALIRALCRVGRTAPHAVVWRDDRVLVPLRPLAIAWLEFYWPLLTSPEFIAQRRGERPDSTKPVAFRRAVEGLAIRYGASALPRLLDDLDVMPSLLDPELRKIAETIVVGPVRYSGIGDAPLFSFERPGRGDAAGGFGWVVVPAAVWLDLVRFDHWIEDSVVIRWAQLTAEMNPAATAARFVPLLLTTMDERRDTAEVRAALDAREERPIVCAWTGAPLTLLHIDHVVPYSVWGNNDLWNLLPAAPRVNLVKSDALPTHRLLAEREEVITRYWRVYATIWSERFAAQLRRALGADPAGPGWERQAFGGMSELIERIGTTRGLRRWDGPGPG